MEERKNDIKPELPPESSPNINPEIVKETFQLLASKGILFFTEKGAYIPTEMGWKLFRRINTYREILRGIGNKEFEVEDENSIKFCKEKNKSCLIINIDKGSKELNENLKNALRNGGIIEIIIEVENEKEVINGFGSPALKMENEKEIEIRKDDKVNDGTIGIMCNKGIKDLKESLVRKIKEGKEVYVEIVVRI